MLLIQMISSVRTILRSLSSISGFVPGITRLSSCVTDLANSYASLRLQLNPSKTEFIWFGTRHNLAKLPTECCSYWPSVRQSFSALVSSVISESCWTVSYPCKATSARSPVHVSIIWEGYVRSGTMSLKKLWHNSWHHSSFLALTTVILRSPAFLHLPWRLCNEYRCSKPRIVLNLTRQSHTTPALQQLHWLLVKYRIIFKIATLMHHILHDRCQSYLADLVAFNTANSQVSTTATRVVTNQSCSRETDTDPIW